MENNLGKDYQVIYNGAGVSDNYIDSTREDDFENTLLALNPPDDPATKKHTGLGFLIVAFIANLWEMLFCFAYSSLEMLGLNFDTANDRLVYTLAALGAIVLMHCVGVAFSIVGIVKSKKRKRNVVFSGLVFFIMIGAICSFVISLLFVRSALTTVLALI